MHLFCRNDKIHSMILGSDIAPSKKDIFTENVTIVFRMLEVRSRDNKGTMRVLAGICRFHLSYFLHLDGNGRLFPQTSA